MTRSAAILLSVSMLFAPALAAQHRVTLDPSASELAFSFDTTLHMVHGTLALTSGEIVVDSETGKATGEIVVNATRTDTGNVKRDRKMHEKILETAMFPTFVFRAERIEGEFKPAGTSEIELIGTMEIHGSVHPFTMPAVVEVQDDRVSARTAFVVPYVEWGMKNPSLFILRVSKTVDVEIEARGSLDADAVADVAAPRP